MSDFVANEEVYRSVALVGQILGPFYVSDPQHDEDITPAFAAISQNTPAALASEWPFIDEAVAEACFTLMQQGWNTVPSEDMVWEFRRLFVGPNPMPVPPYGSVYTDPECVVRGASTLDLRLWMRQVGIDRFSSGKDADLPEDQIGLMLLQMSWIANHRSDLLPDFLRLHFLPWSHHVLQLLVAACEHPFYEGLSRLTDETLEGMRRQLALEVVYPRFYR